LTRLLGARGKYRKLLDAAGVEALMQENVVKARQATEGAIAAMAAAADAAVAAANAAAVVPLVPPAPVMAGGAAAAAAAAPVAAAAPAPAPARVAVASRPPLPSIPVPVPGVFIERSVEGTQKLFFVVLLDNQSRVSCCFFFAAWTRGCFPCWGSC
jgi:hypothetical protein